jgi:hypothetical protein
MSLPGFCIPVLPKATLSRTVRQGRRRCTWKTKPRSRLGPVNRRPSSETAPSKSVYSQATMRSSVVLPQPLAPTIQINSPGWIVRLTFRRAGSACAAVWYDLRVISMLTVPPAHVRRSGFCIWPECASVSGIESIDGMRITGLCGPIALPLGRSSSNRSACRKLRREKGWRL